MKSIQDHIKKDMDILDNPTISKQQRRHIEGELKELKVYQKNHPGESHDPTPLELYCDSFPEADECRVYED